VNTAGTWGTYEELAGNPLGTWWEHNDNKLGSKGKIKIPSPTPLPKPKRKQLGPLDYMLHLLIGCM